LFPELEQRLRGTRSVTPTAHANEDRPRLYGHQPMKIPYFQLTREPRRSTRTGVNPTDCRQSTSWRLVASIPLTIGGSLLDDRKHGRHFANCYDMRTRRPSLPAQHSVHGRMFYDWKRA
jgi:hypothetical protein